MNEWILICNNNYFDIRKAFENETIITWRSRKESIKGILYIFM